MINRLLLLSLIFILFQNTLQAQEGFFENRPITVTIFNHSIGVPFKDYFKKPLNIGIAIGTEFTYRQQTYNSTHQSLQIGWYHHKNLGSGFLFKSDLIQRFNSSNNIWGEVSISAGYFHTFSISDVYQLNEKGNYQKTADTGSPAFLFGGGFGGGFQINTANQFTTRPFIKYEALLETPYTSFIPIMPHTLLEIGSRFGN